MHSNVILYYYICLFRYNVSVTFTYWVLYLLLRQNGYCSMRVSYVADVDPLQVIYLLVFLYCPQIKADKSTKNGQLYYVKRIGINNLECTWEPKSHFVGTATETKL